MSRIQPAGTTCGCLGKFAYPNRADAAEAAHHLRKRGKGHGLAPYSCRVCGRFHLGRDPRQRPPKELKPVPDGARDSFKNRKRRYEELTK